MAKRKRTQGIGPLDLPHIRRKLAVESAETLAEQDALGLHPDTSRTMHAAVCDGDLYFVEADMVTLGVDAASDAPSDRTVTLRSDRGVMLLGRSLPDTQIALLAGPVGPDGAATVKAAIELLMWSCTSTELHVDCYARVGNNPDFVSFLGDARDPQSFHPILSVTFGREEGYYVGDGELTVRNAVFSAASLHEEAHTDTSIRALGRWLTVTWQLIAEPRVAQARTLDTKTGAALNAASSGGSSDSVHVVNVRPLLHKPSDPDRDSGPGRTYKHRWVVRGHWRQQACGEGNEDRRATWVPSHIKGPANAPLKAQEVVWRWS